MGRSDAAHAVLRRALYQSRPAAHRKLRWPRSSGVRSSLFQNTRRGSGDLMWSSWSWSPRSFTWTPRVCSLASGGLFIIEADTWDFPTLHAPRHRGAKTPVCFTKRGNIEAVLTFASERPSAVRFARKVRAFWRSGVG